MAQHWVDHPWEGNGQVPPVEGEQFADLVNWLELGLTRMEIEAIKARGVSRLLKQLEDTIESNCPPDLTEPAERIRSAWSRQLGDEADAAATVLLNTLDPYQKEIEHHFAAERQKRFSGLMSWYLQAFNKLRYTGSTLARSVAVGHAWLVGQDAGHVESDALRGGVQRRRIGATPVVAAQGDDQSLARRGGHARHSARPVERANRGAYAHRLAQDDLPRR